MKGKGRRKAENIGVIYGQGLCYSGEKLNNSKNHNLLQRGR